MDLSRIGTLGAYMKNMQKYAQWQLKQETGHYTSHGKSLSEWLEETSRKNDTISLAGAQTGEEDNSRSDPEVQRIYYKVQSGKKLTAKEKAYLRERDPEVYAKAASIEQERKAYARQIRQCRTKEDVQRLKMSRVGASLSAINEIKNNPVIPLEKKLEYTMLENAKVSAINEETTKFVKSGQYDRLPTEAEYREAMKELQEETRPAPKAEQTEKEEKAEAMEGEAAADPAGAGEEAKAAKRTGEDAAEAERKIDEGADADEESIRKTKRARAKAAYGAFPSEGAEADALADQVITFSRSV